MGMKVYKICVHGSPPSCFTAPIPWFQRFIFILFIAKGRGKINLWNQGTAPKATA
jgi:hypothetical protein